MAAQDCPEWIRGIRKEKKMMDEATMRKLQQDEDMAYFRADLCLSSPESYSPEEKKRICNDMAATTMAQPAAMSADFKSMPPELRSKLLDMLCQSGVESPQWWWDVLVGEGDPAYRDWEPLE